MADIDRVVEILFKGTDEVSSVLGSINSGIGDFASGVEQFSAPFANLAKTILGVETAVGVALVALGTFSVQSAGNFETGMNEIFTLLDPAKVNFKEFSDDIRDYIASSTQDIDGVLLATYEALSQGIPAPDVTNFLSSVEKLAVAGKSTLPDAVNLLAGTANAYNMTMAEVSMAADLFFTAVKDGKTTIPELATAIGQVTAVAAPFGLGVSDITAAIAALTAYGVPSTAQAATILKSLINGLIKPSKEAAEQTGKLAEVFGADVFKNHTLSEVIKIIGQETGKTAGEVQKLFDGQEALGAILPLMNDVAGTYAKAVKDMGTAAGAVTAAFDIMKDNFGFANQQMINSIQSVLISIGLPLLDNYKEAVKSVGTVFNTLSSSIDSGALAPLIKFFEDLLTSVAANAEKIAKVLPEALANVDYSKLIESFRGIGTDLGNVMSAILGEGVDLTTAEGIQKVLQAIVDAFTGLSNASAGIISALPPFFEVIVSVAKSLESIGAENIILIGKALGGLLLLNVAATTAGGISSTLTGIGTAVEALGKVNVAGIGTLIKTLAPLLGTGAAVVGAGVAGYGIGTMLNETINNIVDLFSNGENDTLGGLVYDWINGGPDVDSAIDSRVLALNKIPIGAKKASDDTAAVVWTIDKDGTLINSVGAVTDAVALKLKELTSKETIVKIQAQADIDLAKIKAQTDVVIKSLELEGLNVKATTQKIKAMYEFNSASVISEADKIKAAFDASASSIGSLSTELSGFGDLFGSENLNWADRMEVGGWIDQQLEQQQKLIDSQTKLSDAQTALAELKYEKLSSGEALIKIDSSGLEPALEQVLWSIMEKVQLKVAMEEAELLLAIGQGA